MKYLKVVLGLIMAFALQQKINATTIDLNKCTGWQIYVASDAIASEKFAAEEFQSLFEKATGNKLSIINTIKVSRNIIYIGFSDEVKKNNTGIDIAKLGNEGLHIKIEADRIYIVGGRTRGTLYGVYEFAERYLGVRFLTPEHTYVPAKKSQLTANCEDYEYKPAFIYRNTYYKQMIDNPYFSIKLGNNAFAKDDKLGGASPLQFVVHSFYRQIPVEKYGKEHPEYFAEVGGKRLLEAYGGGPQLCVTNPDVIRLMKEAIYKEIKDNPEQKNFAIVHNDNEYYCRCARCEAINQREESPMAAHLMMVNAVADCVAVKYPGIIIGTLAYQYTRKAPKTIKPVKNVMVQLCSIECDLTHPVNQPDNEMNKPFAVDLKEWGKICKNLWIWDYIVDYNLYNLPFPNLKSISKNIKYYRDNNVTGVFMEVNYQSPAGELEDLRNYITSKCLWNPELDSWELAMEFCKLHYHKASQPIIDYLTMFHDNIDKKHLKARFNAIPEEVGLNVEMSEKILQYFDKALKLADNEEVRARVEKAALSAYCAYIETNKGECKYDKGKLNYQFTERYRDAVRKYIDYSKKHKMTYSTEGNETFFPIYANELNKELKINAEGGRPAVRLENDKWRVTLLQEENAKIVDLYYKPKKVNLLSAMDNNLQSSIMTEEIVKPEYKDTIPPKWNYELKDNVLLLTRNLADGNIYSRKITLSKDRILFESEIIQKGNTKTYRIKVSPVFYTGKRTRDTKIISAYLKKDNNWLMFNEGLLGSHGPNEKLLKECKDGGEYALYNSELKSGINEMYNPKDVETLNASWISSGSLFNLGFTTKDFNLKTGENFSFSYSLGFLDKQPISK